MQGPCLGGGVVKSPSWCRRLLCGTSWLQPTPARQVQEACRSLGLPQAATAHGALVLNAVLLWAVCFTVLCCAWPHRARAAPAVQLAPRRAGRRARGHRQEAGPKDGVSAARRQAQLAQHGAAVAGAARRSSAGGRRDPGADARHQNSVASAGPGCRGAQWASFGAASLGEGCRRDGRKSWPRRPLGWLGPRREALRW